MGLIFYTLFVAVALSTDEFWGRIDDSIWPLWAPMHYLLMGIFLNPSLPERQRERRLYANSRWSHPLSWILVLGTGTLLPTLYTQDGRATELAVYTLLAGLGSGLLARGLARKKTSSYPVILGAIWLVLSIIPPFFALGGVQSVDKAFHPCFISPLIFLMTGLENSWTDVAVTPLVFYFIMVTFGAWLCVRNSAARTALVQEEP